MRQSHLRYTATNAPAGFKEGDQEQSFCIFQIHEPVHKEMIDSMGLHDYRTNVESCVLAAKQIYKNAGGFGPWSVYPSVIAMR